MEFICIVTLALAVIFMWVALDRHKTKIVMLEESLKAVDRLLGEMQDHQREFDHRLSTLERNLAKADEIIRAQDEYEKEAAKAEQLFQEGLQNILSYGVIKNE